MTKIATTADSTVWKCDNCEKLFESANAFQIPPGWWQVHVERRTDVDEYGHGGKLKRGSVDVCCKACLLDSIKYNNQHWVEYV